MPPADSPWWGTPRGWSTGWDWSRPDVTGPVVTRLVEALKSKYLGAAQSFELGGKPLTLTPVDLAVDLGRLALTTGQLDEVVLRAKDLSWGDLRSATATATFRNTCLRVGAVNQVVAAPVDVEFVVASADLDALLFLHRPALHVEVTDDARVLVRRRSRPDWASLEVHPETDGALIRLSARQLSRGSRGTQVVRRLPPVAIRIPVPPGRLNIISITPADGCLVVQARVDEIRVPLGAWSDLPGR